MTSGKRRFEIALQGGRPDRVPTAAIYDVGYMMRCTGRNEREWITATPAERLRAIEEMFLRHEVDCYFVHVGATDDYAEIHVIEKTPQYWLIANKQSGERCRLLPDGSRVGGDGAPLATASGGMSLVQSETDIERYAPPIHAVDGPKLQARFAPLRLMTAKYPDHHFSTQLGSAMVWALKACGGFVEGLTMMAQDRDLFRELLARCVQSELAKIAAARAAAAHSVWFTSYYVGADTISPRDYEDLVFPFDREICAAAKDAGLFVLHWYLGDLMPNLDTVMRLPQDALVLEQGRKGYAIDPVEIRKRVGPRFCIFGYGYENDYCTGNRERLSGEFRRQFDGAGRDGAFVAGTPIMPPNAMPEMVDFYFAEARTYGQYKDAEPVNV